jgi:hypothetical protein
MLAYLVSHFMKPKSLEEWGKVYFYALANYFFWGFIWTDVFCSIDSTKILRWILKGSFLVDMWWTYKILQPDQNKENETDRVGKSLKTPQSNDKKNLSAVLKDINQCINKKRPNLNEINDDIVTKSINVKNKNVLIPDPIENYENSELNSNSESESELELESE